MHRFRAKKMIFLLENDTKTQKKVIFYGQIDILKTTNEAQYYIRRSQRSYEEVYA
tara:strand:+ start:583 stop:747 length:165 start_codon:yes stop_codon:yes gene_type:complete